jgi:uncharacterized membrane protein
MWKPLIIIFVLLIVFDAIYFQFIYNLFSTMVTKIQGFPIKLKLESAILCYLALTGLIYYFIIQPKRSPIDAAFLGLGVYAVYETTNYAVLQNWDVYVAIIDTLWGGLLFYLVTVSLYSFNHLHLL